MQFEWGSAAYVEIRKKKQTREIDMMHESEIMASYDHTDIKLA